MIIPREAFARVRERLERGGTFLTGLELSRLAQRYVDCRGTEPWDVREYARLGAAGAREYRVVRGTGIDVVYTSPERASAMAVQATLNELEAEPD